MRILAAACLLIVIGCDPSNSITVSFPVPPASVVTAHWVRAHAGRNYAHGTLFRGSVPSAEFTVTQSECCGTAADYRDNELWFIACVETPGADPTLVCGRPGQPADQLIRNTVPGRTCAALDPEIVTADIAVATCTYKP